MSLIVLDIELTEKDIIEELGLYIDSSLQGFSFCNNLINLLNLVNRQHGIQAIYMELRRLVENWIMISSSLSFTRQR